MWNKKISKLLKSEAEVEDSSFIFLSNDVILQLWVKCLITPAINFFLLTIIFFSTNLPYLLQYYSLLL